MKAQANGARRARGMRRARSGLLLAWLPVALSGCLSLDVDTQVQAALSCTPPALPMARLELIFGSTRSDGSPISVESWSAFLREEVTPRFPDGLTQFDVYGQWRRPDGAIAKLPSRMLLIWYPLEQNAHDADARIEAIRSRFKQQFDQLSVMRVDGQDCVSF